MQHTVLLNSYNERQKTDLVEGTLHAPADVAGGLFSYRRTA
jgi:hypothetical protein